MSTLSAAVPASKSLGRDRRHRLWIALGMAAGAAALLFLLAHGVSYYLMPSEARVLSAQHAELKPSGRLGHALGMVGAGLFCLMYLYPLRKRWKWLGRFGKTKHWLDYHILMGLTAPMLVTFHSAFKLQGIAGLAYWIMVAVVLSGIVGRYLYARIPRRLDQAEMSFEEMRELSTQLSAQLQNQKALPPELLGPIFELPRMEEVQALPLWRALGLLVYLDARRMYRIWRLRRHAHVAGPEFRKALEAVQRQSGLSRDVLFLSKLQRMFHMWHVIHRPFSYSFALLILLHIGVVLVLGYY